MDNFEESWKEYKDDPERYWTKIANRLHWHKKWDKVMDTSNLPFVKWFPGAELSITYNCLDKQLQDGHEDKTIIVHESCLTHQSTSFTYKQVFDQVSRLAGALREYGIIPGDRILVNMPTIPEAIIAVHAVMRIGAVFSINVRDLTHRTLIQRIESFKPKLIITADFGFQEDVVPMKMLLDMAINEATHQPKFCIVYQRNYKEAAKIYPDRDIYWSDAMKCKPLLECVPVDATSPLFVQYSSGSTGKPKGIVHAVGSFSVNVMNHHFQSLYNPNGTFVWSASQIAWIVGSFIQMFGSFLTHTPTLLYEGPMIKLDVESIYRFFHKYKVTNIFLPLNTLRTFKKMDPNGEVARKYGPFSVTQLSYGGGSPDSNSVQYIKDTLAPKLHQVYGQTEIGGAMTTTIYNSDGELNPQPALSSGKARPGWEVKIFNEDGKEAAVGERGRILVKLASAPGLLSTVLNDEKLCVEQFYSSFPGYYDSKDEGYLDEDGYLYVLNRADDGFKFEGERFATLGIERTLLTHPDVEDSVVVLDAIKNEQQTIMALLPVAFYTTTNAIDSNREEQLTKELIRLVLEEYGSKFPFKEAFHVKSIPRATEKFAKGAIQNLLRNHKSMKEPPDSTEQGMLDIWNALQRRAV